MQYKDDGGGDDDDDDDDVVVVVLIIAYVYDVWKQRANANIWAY